MSTDYGLEHIQKLGIRAAKTTKDIEKKLSKTCGPLFAKKYMEDIYDTAKESQEAMYSKKNSNYEASMIFSGGYDADIVRNACNWIGKHQEYFGDNILEIGCDCGFITTFLGSLFPDKHIVAIDRNREGLEIARINVKKFGLTNVEFINEDASELNGKQFDTVFSMRTMQENSNGDSEEDPYNDLFVQAGLFADEKRQYAKTIRSLLMDSGIFISIERTRRDPLFLGWMMALCEQELVCNIDTFEELNCFEVGENNTFEAVVYEITEKTDNVFDKFMKCCEKTMNTTLTSYYGWEAKIMYEYVVGKKYLSYEIIDTLVHSRSKVILADDKRNDHKVILFQCVEKAIQLEFFPKYQLSKLESDFEKELVAHTGDTRYKITNNL